MQRNWAVAEKFGCTSKLNSECSRLPPIPASAQGLGDDDGPAIRRPEVCTYIPLPLYI